MTLRVHAGNPQCDGPGRALVSVFQIDEHLGVMVLAAGVEGRMPPTARVETPPEQGFEEIAVIRRIAARETAAAEFEACVPVRAADEIPARL